jgi:hypothetical protein
MQVTQGSKTSSFAAGSFAAGLSIHPQFTSPMQALIVALILAAAIPSTAQTFSSLHCFTGL